VQQHRAVFRRVEMRDTGGTRVHERRVGLDRGSQRGEVAVHHPLHGTLESGHGTIVVLHRRDEFDEAIPIREVVASRDRHAGIRLVERGRRDVGLAHRARHPRHVLAQKAGMTLHERADGVGIAGAPRVEQRRGLCGVGVQRRFEREWRPWHDGLVPRS
jgi:hypothetical protein